MPLAPSISRDVPACAASAESWSGTPGVDPAYVESLRTAVARDLGGRYQVRGFLGHGAFATVWEVTDQLTREVLAVKRFAKQSPGRSFYPELRALFRLQHPHVVRIVNLLEIPQGPRYLFLECCYGGNLRDVLQKVRREQRPLPLTLVHTWACQIASALQDAHRLRILHRDLKPENILFTHPGGSGAEPVLKLADFGLALALHRADPEATNAQLLPLTGTPAYMAPELFTGQAQAASDLYALGIILYELLHGFPPFQGTPEELARQHLQKSPTLAATLPEGWRRLVTGLLEKNPAQRPTAAQLGQHLVDLPVHTSSSQLRAVPTPPLLPASSFALFCQQDSVGNTATMVASQEGLWGLTTETVAECSFLSLPELRQVRQASDGSLWCLQPQRLIRCHPQGVLKTILEGRDEYHAFALGLAGQFAVAQSTEILTYAMSDTDSSSTPRLLHRMVYRNHGLPLRMAWGPHDVLAYAEGPCHPCVCLHRLSEGQHYRLALPGVCWDLLALPPTSSFLALVLRANQLNAWLVDAAARYLRPLPEGEALCWVTCDTAGNIYGLHTDGRLVMWFAQGHDRPPLLLARQAPNVRSLLRRGNDFLFLQSAQQGCTLTAMRWQGRELVPSTSVAP